MQAACGSTTHATRFRSLLLLLLPPSLGRVAAAAAAALDDVLTPVCAPCLLCVVMHALTT
jgi:hypothetical protein